MLRRFADHLGFGCVGLTAFATPWRARQVLKAAYAAGIRHFDTAPGYGAGYSELLLGGFLRDCPDATITTKLGGAPARTRLPVWLALALNRGRRLLRPAPAGPRALHPPLLTPRRITREDAMGSLARSRRALRREKIDCLLLHEAVPAFLEDRARDFLFAERARGAIGRLGLAAHGSNYLALTADELEGWDVLQYEFGHDWPAHGEIARRFPGKVHFCHSCLRGDAPGQTPGARLAACQRATGAAKVIFSSRNPAHIAANVAEAEAAAALPPG